MQNVIIQVNYLVKEEHLSEFIQILKLISEKSIKEPGCLNYEASIDGNHIFLYEKYENKEAFEQHKLTPHYVSYSLANKDLLISKEVKIFHEI